MNGSTETVSIATGPGRSAAARVAPNAWHAFGGIWRLTFRRFLIPTQALTMAAMIGLLAVLAFAIVREGSSARFFSEWTLDFYLTFLVPIAAFLSGAAAMREEMKAASVDYVLTRPVFRPAFVVFKFISHLVCVEFVCLFALAVIITTGMVRNIPGVSAIVWWLLLAQVLLVAAFTAFGFVCAAITSRYLVLGLFYAGIVEIGLGRIPTQIGRLSITQQVRALLEPLMPAAPPGLPPAPSLAMTVAIILFFTAVMIAIVSTIFWQREFAGAGNREG